jgi:plastocyanin
MRHLRASLASVLAVGLVLLVAAAALAATKTVGVTKSGTKFKFNPCTVRIKKGDTVKWSWSGSVPHNVTGRGFKSKTGAKVTFSRKFTKSGSFKVVCTIHQALGQRMTIVVS